MKNFAVWAAVIGCGLSAAGCASSADQQRQWRLYAVDKCEPMRTSGTPVFDRCVEETTAACQAGTEKCVPR